MAAPELPEIVDILWQLREDPQPCDAEAMFRFFLSYALQAEEKGLRTEDRTFIILCKSPCLNAHDPQEPAYDGDDIPALLEEDDDGDDV